MDATWRPVSDLLFELRNDQSGAQAGHGFATAIQELLAAPGDAHLAYARCTWRRG